MQGSAETNVDVTSAIESAPMIISWQQASMFMMDGVWIWISTIRPNSSLLIKYVSSPAGRLAAVSRLSRFADTAAPYDPFGEILLSIS